MNSGWWQIVVGQCVLGKSHPQKCQKCICFTHSMCPVHWTHQIEIFGELMWIWNIGTMFIYVHLHNFHSLIMVKQGLMFMSSVFWGTCPVMMMDDSCATFRSLLRRFQSYSRRDMDRSGHDFVTTSFWKLILLCWARSYIWQPLGIPLGLA